MMTSWPHHIDAHRGIVTAILIAVLMLVLVTTVTFVEQSTTTPVPVAAASTEPGILNRMLLNDFNQLGNPFILFLAALESS